MTRVEKNCQEPLVNMIVLAWSNDIVNWPVEKLTVIFILNDCFSALFPFDNASLPHILFTSVTSGAQIMLIDAIAFVTAAL
jgi:hypothetical protein